MFALNLSAPRFLPLSLPLPSPPAVLSWLGRRLELRIDVQPQPEALDTELDALHRRLHTPGDALYGIATADIGLPGLIVRHREADGEHYVYVVDPVRHCLAGYTVFNRLIEVGRRADPHLRAPHSKYATAYQRRGIARAVYEWVLDGGLGHRFCLLSGARQSPAAHALWQALGRRHPLGYVEVRDKTLRYLGPQVSEPILADLHTRLLLLAPGWTIAGLAARTGMTLGDAPDP